MDLDESPNTRSLRGRRGVAFAVALLFVAIGAFAIGRISTSFVSTPSTTSAAAGFARDMQVHHDQGVELAMIIRDASTDTDIRSLGYDIATSQSNQSGQMLAWLNEWKLPQASPEPAMTWMTRPTLTGAGHDHGTEGAHSPGDPMPGLATREQVLELQSLQGAEAEKLFLQLMIAHHEGAIVMAKAVLDRTEVRVVIQLATSIITAQQGEIAYMKDLLARY
jgi:uncharacterized protein (DUF305 family)